uniref:N-acetyltransferase domain-containing protein n=1 Tax=viral metagenome TaxID=1070528 RepID=A0A6C0F4N7_9ZZZZ
MTSLISKLVKKLMLTDNDNFYPDTNIERKHTLKNSVHTKHKQSHTKKNQNDIHNDQEYITSEVTDEDSYNHFKSLVANSKNLCKGKTHSGKRYKVNISRRKDYLTLQKDNHYRTIYIHDNKEIIAYIGTKKYKKDGGFIFIHKLCSKPGTGQGTKVMNMILDDAKSNHKALGITYVSLTTHNLDLIDYYNKFKPTRTIEVDSPGSKRLIPRRVAYMIWQVSPDMPMLNYT